MTAGSGSREGIADPEGLGRGLEGGMGPHSEWVTSECNKKQFGHQ